MPTDIEQHNNQQTDADHGIHLKKGLVDPGKVVGTNERVLDDQKRGNRRHPGPGGPGLRSAI